MPAFQVRIDGVGSVFSQVLSWFTAPTPIWLGICILAAIGALFWQMVMMGRRLDRHAKSIAHMDEWADAVDHTLGQLEERSRRIMPSSSSAPRSTVDLKKWWQK